MGTYDHRRNVNFAFKQEYNCFFLEIDAFFMHVSKLKFLSQNNLSTMIRLTTVGKLSFLAVLYDTAKQALKQLF